MQTSLGLTLMGLAIIFVTVGILIRGPEVLEDSRTVDTIVLDKTGTVTEGRMALADVLVLDPAFVAETGASRSAFVDETAPDQAADVLLTLAAAVERGSEHPIARAIVAGAEERGRDIGLHRVHQIQLEETRGECRPTFDQHVARPGVPQRVQCLAGRGVLLESQAREVAIGDLA